LSDQTRRSDMKPYSQDLRLKVLGAYDRGMDTRTIAEAFDVSPAWARRVRQRRREHGETAPRPPIGRPRHKIDRARLRQLVERTPDATLAELREQLGIVCSLSAVWTAVRQLGLSYKKRPSTPRSRIVRTSRRGGPSGSSGRLASTHAG
jgi:transposase